MISKKFTFEAIMTYDRDNGVWDGYTIINGREFYSRSIKMAEKDHVQALKDHWEYVFNKIKPRALQSYTAQILGELSRAESLHSWEGNSLVKNALIMLEEAGEVARAVLQHDEEGKTIESVREELIQTAAMCYRILKNLPE